jgi:hypothetical protein
MWGTIKMKDQLDIVAPVIINDSEWFLAELCQFPLLNMPKITLCPFREGISQNSKFVMYENMTYERTRGIWVCNCIKLVH